MPKFKVTIGVEDYWEYVVEADSEDEALRDGERTWGESIDLLLPTIYAVPVDDDAEVGDV